MRLRPLLSTSLLAALAASPALSGAGPAYPPTGLAPDLVDIRTDAYGASGLAPAALRLGAKVPDFALPTVEHGTFRLKEARGKAPVVILFYRGHW